MNLSDDHQDVVPVIRRPEYTVSLEQANADTTFIHCTIHVPWTGRVKRKLMADWESLHRLHGGPFAALVSPDDTKLQRFARLFGLRLEASLTDLSTGRTNLIYRN